LRWSYQLVSALAALAQAKPYPIVHADVTPRNLLIDDRNNLLLADFGIAQFRQKRELQQGAYPKAVSASIPPEIRYVVKQLAEK